MANKMLQRVRELFDDELKKGIVMTATYRSGINIKFGKPYFDLLGQVTYNTSDGADWSKGAIMFDFPCELTPETAAVQPKLTWLM